MFYIVLVLNALFSCFVFVFHSSATGSYDVTEGASLDNLTSTLTSTKPCLELPFSVVLFVLTSCATSLCEYKLQQDVGFLNARAFMSDAQLFFDIGVKIQLESHSGILTSAQKRRPRVTQCENLFAHDVSRANTNVTNSTVSMALANHKTLLDVDVDV